MAGVDAGVLVTCSGCGNTVMQKAMVPVLVTPAPPAGGDAAAAGAGTMGYLCIACARLRIAIPAEDGIPVDGSVPAGRPISGSGAASRPRTVPVAPA